ncbi:acyltransferase family protein [Duganella qianjiadongensis]|uniref:DUF1624 domain-containing protein n=1 Tax=Duganella qianjiadongensis TaxID=2692176 RepID=A0ABW9VMU4_9BURK|nr:heparan-alpha-glucosaminide N-acetyltransferase domain-containing protein [Duganella qianjiadongensis]MYM40027.1 DUF1624 domain-containing protein [Duganella qianjiadongensis]
MKRLLALDVLRGLTVALMIVVNTPGDWDSVYAPLLHVQWHGFTPTDWVFPTFLFVVGNALSFAVPRYAAQGHGAVLRKALKRNTIIFLLGFALFWFPFVTQDASGSWGLIPLAGTRIPGVLQRIALCSLLATFILNFWGSRGAVLYCVLALLGYWGVLLTFGDLTLTGNAPAKFDIWLLGAAHLYHGEGLPFDPEGLLGTLPATVNVIAGYFTGRMLLQQGTGKATLRRMVQAGVLLVLLALCWQLVLPLNKKLWTSSYALLTIGLDLLILALLVYAIEVRGQRGWTYFFEVFGKNTLFIYMLSELAVVVLVRMHVGTVSGYTWLYQQLFQPLAPPQLASLLFAICFMLLCWLVGWRMDQRQWYVKV